VAALNENHGQSVRGAARCLKRQRLASSTGKGYITRYKGRERTSPSRGTVQNVKDECQRFAIRVRPTLNKENQVVRLKFAQDELAMTDAARNENVAAIDEAWVTLDKRGTGTMCLHPEQPLSVNPKKIRHTRNKNHVPKVMIIAVIACPTMLNKATACATEPARFHAVQNGKVALFRCVEEQAYKRVVKDKVTGQIKHDVGDPKVVSVTMDGPRYADFLTKTGGVFDKLREYYGPDVEIRMQEDGAPGHGYNNKAGRKPTAPHESMTKIGLERKIRVFKQPHNAPELNPLDLGIWYAIQSRVKHMVVNQSERGDDSYTESQIWKAVKQAWEDLEPLLDGEGRNP
jgi:hypothetical protein